MKKNSKKPIIFISIISGAVVLLTSVFFFPSEAIAITKQSVKNFKKYGKKTEVLEKVISSSSDKVFQNTYNTTHNNVANQQWFKINFVLDIPIFSLLKNFFTSKKTEPAVILLPKKYNFWTDMNVLGPLSLLTQSAVSSFFLISTYFIGKKTDQLDFKEKKINGRNQMIFSQDLLDNLHEKNFSTFITNFFFQEYFFERNLSTELCHLYKIIFSIRQVDEEQLVKNLVADYIFKDFYYLKFKELLGGDENFSYLLELKKNPNQKEKRLVIKEIQKIISISGGSHLSSILDGLSRKKIQETAGQSKKKNSVFQNFRCYVAKKRIQYFFEPEIEGEDENVLLSDNSSIYTYAIKFFVGFTSIIFLLCVFRVLVNRILISQELDSIENYLFKIFGSLKNIFSIGSETDTNEFDVNKFIQNDLASQNLIRECSKNKVKLEITLKELELQTLEVEKIKNERLDYVIDLNDRYKKVIDEVVEEMTSKVALQTSALEDSYKKKIIQFTKDMEAKVVFQTNNLKEQLEKNCLARLEEAMKKKAPKTLNFFDENEDETED